jgi:hypothetical protein
MSGNVLIDNLVRVGMSLAATDKKYWNPDGTLNMALFLRDLSLQVPMVMTDMASMYLRNSDRLQLTQTLAIKFLSLADGISSALGSVAGPRHSTSTRDNQQAVETEIRDFLRGLLGPNIAQSEMRDMDALAGQRVKKPPTAEFFVGMSVLFLFLIAMFVVLGVNFGLTSEIFAIIVGVLLILGGIGFLVAYFVLGTSVMEPAPFTDTVPRSCNPVVLKPLAGNIQGVDQASDLCLDSSSCEAIAVLNDKATYYAEVAKGCVPSDAQAPLRNREWMIGSGPASGVPAPLAAYIDDQTGLLYLETEGVYATPFEFLSPMPGATIGYLQGITKDWFIDVSNPAAVIPYHLQDGKYVALAPVRGPGFYLVKDTLMTVFKRATFGPEAYAWTGGALLTAGTLGLILFYAIRSAYYTTNDAVAAEAAAAGAALRAGSEAPAEAGLGPEAPASAPSE